eukprot:3356550-Pyramimonas_sp.AAC.1
MSLKQGWLVARAAGDRSIGGITPLKVSPSARVDGAADVAKRERIQRRPQLDAAAPRIDVHLRRISAKKFSAQVVALRLSARAMRH